MHPVKPSDSHGESDKDSLGQKPAPIKEDSLKTQEERMAEFEEWLRGTTIRADISRQLIGLGARIAPQPSPPRARLKSSKTRAFLRKRQLKATKRSQEQAAVQSSQADDSEPDENITVLYPSLIQAEHLADIFKDSEPDTDVRIKRPPGAKTRSDRKQRS
jgi:hypothetical protein